MICRDRKEAAMSTRGRKETAQGQRVSTYHAPAECRTGLGGVAWRDRSRGQVLGWAVAPGFGMHVVSAPHPQGCSSAAPLPLLLSERVM